MKQKMDVEEVKQVLQLGLEGLVLKDLESKYVPGKRHWLKVKKDYLFDGAMADTADLVVLGAWFGTGKKGGMMSVFLMGCLNTRRNVWVTVTKVHTGHDDSTLERLQKELGPKMVKISGEYGLVPHWLDCNKGMVPDFVAKDPKDQPVWEITGTELTKANLHTADGISVRFPRVTRIRDDKNWESATNLEELKNLYNTSKEKTDVSLLNKLAETASSSYEPPVKKIKQSPSKGNLEKYLVRDISQKNTKIEKNEKQIKVKDSIKSKAEELYLVNDTSPKKRKIVQKEKQIEVKNSIKTEADENGLNELQMNEKVSVKNEIDTDLVDKINDYLAENPLPDVFLDKKLGFYPDFLSISEEQREHFERHWIAYGGIVVKSIQMTEVDFVLHKDDVIEFKKMIKLKKRLPKGVRHITQEWLTQSINAVDLIDPKYYSVVVVPYKSR